MGIQTVQEYIMIMSKYPSFNEKFTAHDINNQDGVAYSILSINDKDIQHNNVIYLDPQVATL
jgi:hypothetical protein